MDITELLDLLNDTQSFFWMEISEELLAAGYSWEYSAATNCYRLLDLYHYFE